MKKMKKNASTLAEVMIALSIIAFLGLLFLPVINDSISTYSEKLSAVKADGLIKEIVDHLLNQSSLYPKHNFANFNGRTPSELEDKDYRKFREAFRDFFVNPKEIECHLIRGNGTNMTPTVKKELCFVGIDGIVWGIPNTDFAQMNTLKTTVNGVDNFYVPITVYPNINNAETSEDFLYDNAILYGLRRDGKLIFLNSVIDAKIEDEKDRAETMHYKTQTYIQNK